MKKGMILAISLGFIALLTSIIYLFLHENEKIKKTYAKELSNVQIASLYSNLQNYLQNIEIDSQMLFYASKMKFPVTLGEIDIVLSISSDNDKIQIKEIDIVLSISSDNDKIQINQLLKATQDEKNGALVRDKIEQFFYDWRVANPRFLTDLLLDSVVPRDAERSYGSKIVLNDPFFYDKGILDFAHLSKIIDYYAFKYNDDRVYEIPWQEYFKFEGSGHIDINYASYEVLRFLLDDANLFALQEIVKATQLYEKAQDLPFDSEYVKRVLSSHYGLSLGLESNMARIEVELNSPQYSGKFNFKKPL